MNKEPQQPSTNPGRWAAYYRKMVDRPPRPTLLNALDRFEVTPLSKSPEAPRAIDLGCGGGRDAIELLRRGWRVHAIDAEADALDFLSARDDLPDAAPTLLTLQKSRFEAPDIALSEAHLINSSFALPGCPPDAFPALWKKITNALLPGGRFCGQLYGDRDSWAQPGSKTGASMTFHSRSGVETRLSDFVIEHLEEEESDSVTPNGEEKHWHIFHIVARKPPKD